MASQLRSGSGAEVCGIDAVRQKNFSRIVALLKKRHAWCNTILDVGSAHGIFLKIASQAGFSITGIEPDRELADQCRTNGYSVINGFFPAAPELADKTFDVIIFNDSFEHIPNLPALIGAIITHLTKNGVLIINLPSSDGLVFQSAFLLSKFGIHAQFDRLWQKGFASPHLHYFNARNLKLFFKKYNFPEVYSTALSYYTIKGLYKRIRCKSSLLVSLISWFSLVLLYPLFAIKSDCFVSFFSPDPLELKNG
jgi:SAM-dependent methyltransferase